jgi:hypothetical protein
MKKGCLLDSLEMLVNFGLYFVLRGINECYSIKTETLRCSSEVTVTITVRYEKMFYLQGI